jgi:hypothetical protein
LSFALSALAAGNKAASASAAPIITPRIVFMPSPAAAASASTLSLRPASRRPIRPTDAARSPQNATFRRANDPLAVWQQSLLPHSKVDKGGEGSCPDRNPSGVPFWINLHPIFASAGNMSRGQYAGHPTKSQGKSPSSVKQQRVNRSQAMAPP